MVKVNRSLSQGFCSCCESNSRTFRVAMVRAARRNERHQLRVSFRDELQAIDDARKDEDYAREYGPWALSERDDPWLTHVLVTASLPKPPFSDD